MSQMIDMIGKKFGRYTVLSRAENSTDGKARWLCQCECGNQKVVLGTHLRTGKIKSCGCYSRDVASKNNLFDLTGKKFGKLTVLKRVPGNKNGTVYWECQCECGGIAIVCSGSLLGNKTKSCGCIYSYGEAKIANLLYNNNIKFKKNFYFSDCFYIEKHPLKFDFGILDNNNQLIYLIEYDGIQHYISMDCGWNNDTHLKELQKRDNVKNEYCKNHNIPLIRIPYTEYNDLELKDLILETTNFLIK